MTTAIHHLKSSFLVSKGNTRVYHDAKLLLELYPKVLWRLGESMDELDAECYESDKKHLFDLINSLIDVDTLIDKTRFEHKIQGIEESKKLIELIDRALAKLKTYPANGELYYQILDKVYVKKAFISSCEEELLDALHISRSTYYREKKKAITMLGVILWGFIISEVLIDTKK
jgi:hypothetical protein